MCAYVYACMCVCVHMCVCVCVCVCAHVFVCARVCTYMHVFILTSQGWWQSLIATYLPATCNHGLCLPTLHDLLSALLLTCAMIAVMATCQAT